MSHETSLRYDLLAKVVIIGDGGVGKTALITRFTEGRFYDSYVATIGVDFRSRVVCGAGRMIKLQIWDTAGQERFRNITQAYYRGAAAIILAFSLADGASFASVEKWVRQIDQTLRSDCCKVLVGCKADQADSRVVDRQDAQRLASRMGVQYVECSSKTGDNVDFLFEELAELLAQMPHLDSAKVLTRLDPLPLQAARPCVC